MHNYDERGTFKIYRSFILGKLIFNGVQGHSDASINITIFKTLRRLDTT